MQWLTGILLTDLIECLFNLICKQWTLSFSLRSVIISVLGLIFHNVLCIIYIYSKFIYLLLFSLPASFVMFIKQVLVVEEPLERLLWDRSVCQVADDAHARWDEQVHQLALVLVVGGAGDVPAPQAAEHHLGAGEAGDGGLHGLEAVGAVLAHVLWQHVGHNGLFNCYNLEDYSKDVTLRANLSQLKALHFLLAYIGSKWTFLWF